MSLPDFLDMMPNTVSIKPLSSVDNYGVEAYGTAVEYRARVSFNPQKIRDGNGAEVLARGVIWLGPRVDNLSNKVPATIGEQDEVILPTGDVPIIVAIDNPQDEDGGHHTKIYFGNNKGG